MIIKLNLIIFLIFFLLGVNCKDEPPVKEEPQIDFIFAVEDTTCTEVFFKLHIGNEIQNRVVTLRRDTITLFTKTIVVTDTTIIDENLLPNKTYTYTAIVSEKSTQKTLAVTTMDTTSHNFTFAIDTLGDGASSILYDVAIINDTLAYAVGEIYLKDSTGQIDPLLYNMAKWNGKKWEITRLKVNYKGNLITPSLNAIFAFSSTDIWLSAGVPIHGDGNTWTQYHLFDMGVLTQNDGSIVMMWGKNSGDMYFVGNKGSIVRYTNNSWQKVESGTSVNINDIWGSQQGDYILAAATNTFSTGERKLLRIKDTNVDTVNWSPQQRLHSVWFKNFRKIYSNGGGVYMYYQEKWSEINLPKLFTKRIRGTNINNIWTVGDFGICAHFNGNTWKVISEVSLPDGQYDGLSVTETKIFAVGQIGNRAVVLRGKRN